MVSEFLQPIYDRTDNKQDSLLMKGIGPTLQGHLLHLETIVDESAEGHVSNGPSLNANELYFWLFLWLVQLAKHR